MTRLTELSRSIAGQVAIVTGAASGMGRATALLFADEGARVALVDLDRDRLDPVVALLRSAGHDAEAYAVDLAQSSAIAPLV
ncbi:MAG: SDR family NAD(P)-dependent oxidoreductase, partial [Myxococcota bacterium]|nr:SDR family NAD(P)-dependent oxidoreductase [Myxococcota bacterium]